MHADRDSASAGAPERAEEGMPLETRQGRLVPGHHSTPEQQLSRGMG